MPKIFFRWRLAIAPILLLLLGLASVYAQTGEPSEGSSEKPKPSQGSAQRVPPTNDQPADTQNEAASGQAVEPINRMTNRRLGALLAKHFADFEIEGGDGAWRIELPGLGDNGPALEDDPPGPAEDAPFQNGQAQDPDEEQPDNEEAQPGVGVGERLPPVVLVLTDERANRMRVMIPIRPFDPNRVGDLRLALIALHANYDRALDARYAIKDGVLWSVFIHPLGSLAPDDLESAIKQVITLRRNTGTTFSSSGLLFGARDRGQEDDAEEPGDDLI